MNSFRSGMEIGQSVYCDFLPHDCHFRSEAKDGLSDEQVLNLFELDKEISSHGVPSHVTW